MNQHRGVIWFAVAGIVLLGVFVIGYNVFDDGGHYSSDFMSDGSEGGPSGVFSGQMEVGVDEMVKSEGFSSREISVSDSSSAPVDSSAVSFDVERRVVKNGFLSIVTSDLDVFLSEVRSVSTRFSGGVFSQEVSQLPGSRARSGSVVVKVPVNTFDEAMDVFKQLGVRVETESRSGQDVTEQFVDLRARLSSKRSEEESFLRIFDSAEKVDDVISVTRELSRVRSEIESMEARQRYLESQTEMSSITLSVVEDVKISSVSDRWRPGQVTVNAFDDLMRDVQRFLDGAIVFLVRFIPATLIYGFTLLVVYVIGRWVYRWYTRSKSD